MNRNTVGSARPDNRRTDSEAYALRLESGRDGKYVVCAPRILRRRKNGLARRQRHGGIDCDIVSRAVVGRYFNRRAALVRPDEVCGRAALVARRIFDGNAEARRGEFHRRTLYRIAYCLFSRIVARDIQPRDSEEADRVGFAELRRVFYCMQRVFRRADDAFERFGDDALAGQARVEFVAVVGVGNL